MGRIPESTIDEILSRTDIVETVRRYVNLEKSGSNYKGLCPFHDDHDPSLKVHEQKNIYKCFACGAGGNAIGFLMEIEGWSFPEAVRHLADRHGIELPDRDPEAQKRAEQRREKRERYFEITRMAARWFSENLWSERGQDARAYLTDRGIDEETARTFGLGYALDEWESLLGHMTSQGVDPEELEEAGLVKARDSAGHYDRFRHRIVFPVVDIWRNVRAFGGRTLARDDDTPKYLNSPETPFYEKGEQLYGLHVAKKHFQNADYALLAEGNFDVLALHAAGFETAIAPMGTALTEDQADLLSRYTRRTVIAFDGDSAGADATRRCLPALQSAEIEGRVVRFADGDDPDSFVRREGAEALEARIDESTPLGDWALNRVIAPALGQGAERKMTALEEAAHVLSEIDNRIAWNHYAREVARKLSLDPDQLKSYLDRPSEYRDHARRAVERASRPLDLEKAERGLLVVLLDNPSWIEPFVDEGYHTLLSDARLVDVLERALAQLDDHDELRPAQLLQQLDDQRLHDTVADAIDPGEAYDSDKARDLYHDYTRTLQIRWYSRQLEAIQARIDGLDSPYGADRETFEELCEKKREFERHRDQLEAEKAGRLSPDSSRSPAASDVP
ncbi:MAG: DNA primase [Bradymonadaceae bacterium]